MRRIRDEILAEYLVDNVKARRMTPDGTYKRVTRGEGQVALNSQQILMGEVPRGRKKVRLAW